MTDRPSPEEVEALVARLKRAPPFKPLYNARARVSILHDDREAVVKLLSALSKGKEGRDEPTFQARVAPWMAATFSPEICADKLERCDRLLEETFELIQALGYPAERVATLRDYTWSRPVGEPSMEVGGVMVCLAALCLEAGLDMHEAAEAELARIWTMVEKIRAKQLTKPKGSPLPQPPESQPSLRDVTEAELEVMARASDPEWWANFDMRRWQYSTQEDADRVWIPGRDKRLRLMRTAIEALQNSCNDGARTVETEDDA